MGFGKQAAKLTGIAVRAAIEMALNHNGAAYAVCQPDHRKIADASTRSVIQLREDDGIAVIFVKDREIEIGLEVLVHVDVAPALELLDAKDMASITFEVAWKADAAP
ncbi:hypothetical protein QE432_000282 [Agrobacterium sp. SORGH_AS 745]|nr:hypothetical protein [Agrobacterium sp. SORGH_AS_0745]